MEFIVTENPDVFRIKPQVFGDERGYFMETFRKEVFSQAGIDFDFVQDNQSSSTRYTLRGLHYQLNHKQGKLVRVVIGEIYDVAVDLRKSSEHYGEWIGAPLSAENKEQFWIPPGFAHGFLTLSDRADVIYKATDYYDRESERCILWDDPDLGIDWPIPGNISPLISKKDAAGVLFAEAEVFE